KFGVALNQYRIGEDILLLQDLMHCSRANLAWETGISEPTLNRWVSGTVVPNHHKVDALYGMAFRKGVRINRIKEQFYREEVQQGSTVLFHGAKSELVGNVSVMHSRPNNDFGRGFYCGQTYEQAAMFVAGYEESSVYALSFATEGLDGWQIAVGREWMLAVSLGRGRLSEYADAPTLRALSDRLNTVDYIVAPIADNRMFEVLDAFADGEITDEQCEHALSATDLGMQYVIKSPKAASNVLVLERCFLCGDEKDALRQAGKERTRLGRDKARVARRRYRGKGLYVEELLDGSH
ncbi:MAG: DUF3990 domain-containing protein, partial [Coriobacteriales bacterium]|nr:DUF3990 domain-containing protein [Coriobacteriales bacterium]